MNDLQISLLFFFGVVSLMYAVVLLVSLGSLLHRRDKPIAKNEVNEPCVSVVVAARNEEKNIEATLNSLLSQDYPSERLEIIVCDDHSEDNTVQFVKDFSDRVKVLSSEGVGKKSALRTAWRAAQHEIIVQTDADVLHHSGWLREMVLPLVSDPAVEMTGSGVVYQEGRRFIEWFQETELLFLQGVAEGMAIAGRPVLCNGASIAYRKRLITLNDIPGTGSASGDDIFLLQKVTGMGSKKFRWVRSPDAVVVTRPADTWHNVIEQRVRWASKTGAYADSTFKWGAIAFALLQIQLPLFLAVGIATGCAEIVFYLPVLLRAFVELLFLSLNPDNKRRFLLLFLYPWVTAVYHFVSWWIICRVPGGRISWKGRTWENQNQNGK